MATEEEKKRNLARLNAMLIYGLEKGLWDLLGEAALATTNTIGEGMLEILEKSMGLEIEGETPQDVLTEIARLFVDEYGISTGFEIILDDDIVEMQVQHCVLMDVEKDLVESGIKPFVCPYLNIASAVMRRRLNMKSRIKDLDVNTETHTCALVFEML